GGWKNTNLSKSGKNLTDAATGRVLLAISDALIERGEDWTLRATLNHHHRGATGTLATGHNPIGRAKDAQQPGNPAVTMLRAYLHLLEASQIEEAWTSRRKEWKAE